MAQHLLGLPAEKLLDKFGAGNHKPGSGSAAAYQGLLSAQLTRTVITLTVQPKRRSEYQAHIAEMNRIGDEIERRIYPELARLLQEDSDQFDKVIVLRKERIAAADPLEKNNKRLESLQALRVATELPIEIAELCVELADFASYVFENGFCSARGDSGVALNGAIAAIAGCLSIIDLNLISFTNDDWTDAIRTQVEKIRRQHQELVETADAQCDALRNEAVRKLEFDARMAAIINRARAQNSLTNRYIEQVADDVHRILWRYRETIWKGKVPGILEDLLSPMDLLTAMGFQFRKETSLGQYRVHGETVEVAGLIDRSSYRVAISEQFPLETQNFTAAHELGHAILHDQTVLHRDKAVDGSGNRLRREPIEAQADHFAACFLMPPRMTARSFEQRFRTTSFSLDEATTFALSAADKQVLANDSATAEDIAHVLADATSFGGRFFRPLSKQFSVSKGAMAIRLLELGLIAK